MRDHRLFDWGSTAGQHEFRLPLQGKLDPRSSGPLHSIWRQFLNYHLTLHYHHTLHNIPEEHISQQEQHFLNVAPSVSAKASILPLTKWVPAAPTPKTEKPQNTDEHTPHFVPRLSMYRPSPHAMSHNMLQTLTCILGKLKI